MFVCAKNDHYIVLLSSDECPNIAFHFSCALDSVVEDPDKSGSGTSVKQNRVTNEYLPIYRAFYSACGGVRHGFTPFWHFFYYIRLFRAPRKFLGAVKIAIES